MDVSTLDFIKQQGVAILILAAIGFFIVRQIWPFFTQTWWPIASKRADLQVSVVSDLTAVVSSLKVLVAQIMVAQQTGLKSVDENTGRLIELQLSLNSLQSDTRRFEDKFISMDSKLDTVLNLRTLELAWIDQINSSLSKAP